MRRNSDGIGEPRAARRLWNSSAKPNTRAAPERPDGVPASEDEGGEGDEAPAGGHVLLEAAGGVEAEERAAEAGDGAAEHDGHVAEPEHVDADRVGRRRVLARPPAPGAPTGSGRARTSRRATSTNMA